MDFKIKYTTLKLILSAHPPRTDVCYGLFGSLFPALVSTHFQEFTLISYFSYWSKLLFLFWPRTLPLHCQSRPLARLIQCYCSATLKMQCMYKGKAILHPFAFRVHAHSHGKLLKIERLSKCVLFLSDSDEDWSTGITFCSCMACSLVHPRAIIGPIACIYTPLRVSLFCLDSQLKPDLATFRFWVFTYARYVKCSRKLQMIDHGRPFVCNRKLALCHFVFPC